MGRTNSGRISGMAALTAVALGLLAAPGSEAQLPRLKHATGRINYKLSGVVSGTTIYTWSAYGQKFRQDSQIVAAALTGGSSTPIKTWTLCDGKAFYSFIPTLGQSVIRMPMPKSGKGGSSLGLPSLPPGQKFGKKVGTEKILGRTCEVRQQGENKVSFWEGLPLRGNFTQGGNTVKMVATSLKTGVAVKATMFAVPKGLQVVDGSQFGLGGGAPGGAGARPRPR